MIVHVSGMAARNAVRPWLLNGIRSWRRTHRDFHLFGIFTSLATGRVWNSSFGCRVQEYVTRGIWQLCDGGLTTNSVLRSARIVAARDEAPGPSATRAVFPMSGTRLHCASRKSSSAYGRLRPTRTELGIYRSPHCGVSSRVCKNLGILEIIDIGARAIQPPSHLGQIPIMCLGQLARNTVSQYLMSCRFGLLNYDVARLQKSGVFAAYAAHGVIPICIGSEATPPFGLEEDGIFCGGLKDLARLHAMQTNLRQVC